MQRDPLELLAELVDEYAPPALEDAPMPIAIGTMSYEFGEQLVFGEASRRADGEPDLWFGFYPEVARWDHQTGEVNAMAASMKTAPISKPPVLGPLTARDGDARLYLQAVGRALEYLRAGDIYQVNLSRRLVADVLLPGDPLALYERLFRVNPASYGAVLDRDGTTLLSGSPERFLSRASGARLETRPIKGTRTRGAGADEDVRLQGELAGCDKEAAEHLMIVDLERNDLGRVAEIGSVRVDE
jgi:anthranilate/para-aminobenzoate synthase component I